MRKQRIQSTEETTGLLEESMRLAHETEHIGDATLEELQNQGDVLYRSKRNLSNIQDMTNSAHESVRQIQQKIFQRKIMLWAIMLVLFVIIFIMLLVMFRNGGSLRPR
jgi:t-SNARE complex subunit (syntaxin)